MKHTRYLALLAALLLALCCVSAYAEGEETCTYTIYNQTGEAVVEISMRNTKAEGEEAVNMLAEPLADGASIELSKTVPAGQTGRDVFELEFVFKTESGYTGTFPTLHFETVPITLLKEDAKTGATDISFFAPDVTCTYTVYNVTGENVVEISLRNTKVEGEEAVNMLEEPLADGASVQLSKTVKADKTGRDDFELEFVFKTESGYTGVFPKLHFETVPISLLAEDAKTGATDISFFAPDVTCTYTVYNVTGENVVEISLRNTKVEGEEAVNMLEEPLADGASVQLSKTVKADKTGRDDFELEFVFKTESGYTGVFPKLHFETVPISLLAEDAKTGATDISFFAPDVTCTYTVYNVTGENVVEISLRNTKVEGEEAVNMLEEPLADGASVQLSKTVKADKTGRDDFELEFVFKTESGYTGVFPKLHFETVPISLLAEDAKTGATDISFFAPDATCTYTIYNQTGENVVEFFLINLITGEEAVNLLEEPLAPGAVIELSKTVKADKTGREDFVLLLAFKTESGYSGSFPTLHFETVPITLLAEDAKTGATDISFTAPAE